MSAGRLASAAASRVSRLSPSPTAARAPTLPRTARSSAASSPFIGFFPDTPRILYLPGVNLCLAPFYKDERIARAVPVSRRDSSRRRRSIVDRSIVAATRKQSPSPLASRSRARPPSPHRSPHRSLRLSPSHRLAPFFNLKQDVDRSRARTNVRTGGVCARVMSTKGGLDGVHAPLDPRLFVVPRDGSTFSFSSSASSASSHRPRRNTTPPRGWRCEGWWSCWSSSTSRRATRARGLAYVRTSTVTEVAASSTRRALNIVVVVASPSHAARWARAFSRRARVDSDSNSNKKGRERRGGVRWMDGRATETRWGVALDALIHRSRACRE